MKDQISPPEASVVAADGRERGSRFNLNQAVGCRAGATPAHARAQTPTLSVRAIARISASRNIAKNADEALPILTYQMQKNFKARSIKFSKEMRTNILPQLF